MDDIIEKLAEAEHRQWMEWANSVSGDIEKLLEIINSNVDLSSDEKEFVERVSKRIENWASLMVDYEELSQDEKEKDRVYARAVYEICKNEFNK